MGDHADAPIVLTTPLAESLDDAGFFIQTRAVCYGWRLSDMLDSVFQRRRRSAWPWTICGLLAVLYLLWGNRRIARGIDGREWRAIEEFGCAVAPLMLFALVWLLADPAQQPNARARRRSQSG